MKLKLEKLIAKRTGITISLSSSWELNFNQTAVCCFAAFGTAKEYLKATLKFQQHPHH
ncbi:hypothetical protein M2D07_016230 [Pseudomonas sp. BGr12]|uniref:hypothetical protein n=1 Tax=Pseudomonas sp. BGr12 TaxID=2936269 RepID=UPI00255A1674|nr:hypothetical protein [Pseudomonas sp. BJa5]MDL2428564.1 hypothetical protein [Pseudomonas sp. BJa5]